jgi:N-acetylglucosamine-6-phosphate deacetylase
LHRHANLIWEQLASDTLSATFIADQHHLPDSTLKSMVRAKGLTRTILVTDATAAAVAVSGSYSLGELAIERDVEGRVTTVGTKDLAGSGVTMDVVVANVVQSCGLSLAEVLPLATVNPARALGQEPAGEIVAEWDAAGKQLRIEEVRENCCANNSQTKAT